MPWTPNAQGYKKLGDEATCEPVKSSVCLIPLFIDSAVLVNSVITNIIRLNCTSG